jgi:amino acid adenylation domain-containing protein
MDGWCMSILINEFKVIYTALTSGHPIQATPVIPYSRYIKWLEAQGKEEGLKYWQHYLDGYEEQTTLPQDHPVPIQDVPYKQDCVLITIDKEETSLLKKRSVEYQVTVNTMLQVAWGILLSKYNNVNDVLFGSVVSGRPAAISGIEDMVGLFINTIPVRVSFTATDTIAGLLQRIQAQALESEPYHYHSLADIQTLSALGRGLLDHVLTFENYPIARRLQNAGEGSIDLIQNLEVAEQNNYNYSLTIIPGDDIQVKLDYNSNVYDKNSMEIVLRRLKKVVEQVAKEGDRLLAEIDVLEELEKHQLLYDFNNTKADYSKDKTIVDVFEEQAAKTPRKTAVVFEGKSISYRQLQEQAAKVATYLRETAGVRTGDMVGLMLPRSEYLIPVIFGILKAGAAYVPIDPAYPSARIHAIVEDAGLHVLFTASQAGLVPDLRGRKVVDVEEQWSYIQQQPVVDIADPARPNDLAYVIYTSGSTGKPKGVMIEHHAVLNRIEWMQKKYPIDARDVLLQKTPVVFDVSVWELFWWSFTGASLCLLKPQGEKEPQAIIEAIQKNKVTTIHFVPSMLGAFLPVLDASFNFEALSSLRFVFASGEALKAGHVDLFEDTLYKHAGARLINLYGPTEATVDVSYYDCSFLPGEVGVPIGKPIDNMRLHILDKCNRLAPVGVAGELCIAGVGLARGYLGNEQLTNDKFTPGTYIGEERIYRTGDLARWLPGGDIEYLGRIDHQVKVRGYRIETGEIEYQLKQYEYIRESVVIAREEESDKYLVAYYVADQPLDAALIRAFLLQQLPGFMVPAYFVQLPAFPLTTNGKLDRKSLPAPDGHATQRYIPPANEIEEKLVSLWATILKVDKNHISTHQRFFEVGGHSLKATMLANRIKKDFQTEISLAAIFDNNVKTMADYISMVRQTDEAFQQIENFIEITI